MIAGDTVVVQAGNYAAQRVQVTRSGSSVAMITYQANGTVTMKGFNIQANYITIKGFEIANTSYRRWDRTISSGVYIRGSSNIIENNYIHDASLDGIAMYGPPSDPTTSSNNIIRNNRLYHNENAGMEIFGRGNLIEGNEIWDTVQCHPTMTAVEDVASDNPNHLACPNYPSVSGLDADGIRFFGIGHIFRGNSIHDIVLTDPLNISPHIDCFQTWAGTDYEVGSNILFEKNYCKNLTYMMSGFTLQGGAHDLTIRNNIFKVYMGLNSGSDGLSHNLYIYNNLWISDLSYGAYSVAIYLYNAPYSIVENNIFYNQSYQTIVAVKDVTGDTLDYNLAFNSDGTNAPCMEFPDYACANPAPLHDKWNVNPQFVDSASGDYHINSSSPAIDVGYNLGSLVTDDFNGISRPQGAGYDIGAYEFQFSQ